MNVRHRRTLARILISGAIMAGLSLAPEHAVPRYAHWAGCIAAYLIIGHDILRRALRGIMRRAIFDENFLMAVATLGAIVLGLTDDGDISEAVAVMLFYQIGELFQSAAVGRSRRSIAELMDIRPDYANVEIGGELVRTDPDEVAVGTVITVRPGERVPIDGVVVEGASSLSTAALTGESAPRDVEPGAEVMSGCVCLDGMIKIRTTKEFGSSTASKILELVEDASSRRAEPEKFITRFARVYTPTVCALAALLAIVPPIALSASGASPELRVWAYRALTFLVMSCPCALVVSIPLSFFGGIGGASSRGILVKGADSLEALSMASAVIMDKTGTLTRGDLELCEVRPGSMDPDRLLELAAYAESSSPHPIARSIVRAYGRSIDPRRVADVHETAGGGASASVDGVSVACGSAKFLSSLGIDVPPAESEGGASVVHVACGREHVGALVIRDEAKPTSAAAVRELEEMGIRVVMLTGDVRDAAEAIASELGITDVRSELLPQDKVAAAERMMESRGPRERAIFAGDGINDAPVLAAADVGIAMGGIGSDAAIEAADVVLMDDDPLKIPEAIRISRKCLSIVRQNIVGSVAVKAACLVLSAFGLAGMWAAIFADVGVMVIAVLNAARTMFVRRRAASDGAAIS